MNPSPLIFLVVDYNADSRFLLTKCLLRKFPAAIILEAQDGESAIEMARRGGLAAIISHRTNEMLGVELVERFRQIDHGVPIVMVSGIDRTAPALAAGADRFLLYDEWLRIGTVVQEVIASRDYAAPAPVVEVKLDEPEKSPGSGPQAGYETAPN